MTKPVEISGDTIRLARIGKGFTLVDLASMALISPSYLSKIEHGHRPVPEHVARLLEVTDNVTWYDEILAIIKESDVDAESLIAQLNNAIGV